MAETERHDDRRRLDADRARLQAQVGARRREVDEIIEAADLTPTDDEHDPDGSTIAYERAKATALLDQAGRELAAVDHALERVAAGTYGDCEVCGRAIAPDRLAALPAARTCVACAAAGGGGPEGRAATT